MSILLAVYDIMAVNVSYFLALLFRFDGFFSQIPDYYVRAYVKFIPIYTILCLVIFYASKMYQSVWQYASFNELARTCIGSTVASLLHILLITVIYYRMPISYYLWGSCFQMILLVSHIDSCFLRSAGSGAPTARIMLWSSARAERVRR